MKSIGEKSTVKAKIKITCLQHTHQLVDVELERCVPTLTRLTLIASGSTNWILIERMIDRDGQITPLL